MESKGDNKEKEGVVPKQEISGSDADKAYDQDGNFEKVLESEENTSPASGTPEGSDADTDE